LITAGFWKWLLIIIRTKNLRTAAVKRCPANKAKPVKNWADPGIRRARDSSAQYDTESESQTDRRSAMAESPAVSLWKLSDTSFGNLLVLCKIFWRLVNFMFQLKLFSCVLMRKYIFVDKYSRVFYWYSDMLFYIM